MKLVAALNIALALLAALSLAVDNALWQTAYVAIGAVLVAIVLRCFSRVKN